MASVDDIIEHARNVAHDIPDVDSDAGQLAVGVLSMLDAEKPCGWDDSFVVEVVTDHVDAPYAELHECKFTNADEMRWAAVVLLKAADRMKSNG
jgi:hypothetical protein